MVPDVSLALQAAGSLVVSSCFKPLPPSRLPACPFLPHTAGSEKIEILKPEPHPPQFPSPSPLGLTQPQAHLFAIPCIHNADPQLSLGGCDTITLFQTPYFLIVPSLSLPLSSPPLPTASVLGSQDSTYDC